MEEEVRELLLDVFSALKGELKVIRVLNGAILENGEEGIRIRVRNEFLDDSVLKEAKGPRGNYVIPESSCEMEILSGILELLRNKSEPKLMELRERAEELYSETGETLVKSEEKLKHSETKTEELLNSGIKDEWLIEYGYEWIVFEEEGKGEVFRSRRPEVIPGVLISEEITRPPRGQLLALLIDGRRKYILVRNYSPIDKGRLYEIPMVNVLRKSMNWTKMDRSVVLLDETNGRRAEICEFDAIGSLNRTLYVFEIKNREVRKFSEFLDKVLRYVKYYLAYLESLRVRIDRVVPLFYVRERIRNINQRKRNVIYFDEVKKGRRIEAQISYLVRRELICPLPRKQM